MTTAYNGPDFQGSSTLLETWCVSTHLPGGLWPQSQDPCTPQTTNATWKTTHWPRRPLPHHRWLRRLVSELAVTDTAPFPLHLVNA